MNYRHCRAIVLSILLMATGLVPQLYAQDGTLTFIEYVKDDSNGVDGLASAHNIILSTSGEHAYVSGYAENTIVVFTRNIGTGALAFAEMQKQDSLGTDGIAGAAGITLSPDGRHLYAAGTTEGEIAIFSRDETTGLLTFLEIVKDDSNGVNGLAGVNNVTVSPDGKHAYATGGGEQMLAVFARDMVTGSLSYVESHTDGALGVDGLWACQGVIVSPDGASVYVTGWSDNAVAVFSRNATTGALTFVEVHFDNTAGVDGLGNAYGIAIDSDGEALYIAGYADNAIAMFSRNTSTGALTFTEVQKNDSAGVAGIAGVRRLAISPDGLHFYASGMTDNTLALFDRDSTDGHLTFVENMKNDSAGVVEMIGPHVIAISPDGAQVYVTAYGDSNVVIFSRSQSQPDLTINTMQYNFGAVSVNDSIAVAAIRLENAGGQGHITSASSSDPAFSLAEATPVNLNPGVGTTVTIAFKPTASGPASGTITLNTDDPGNTTFVINVTGEGVVPGDGSLTFLENQVDGVDGVAGLSGPDAIAASPDGRHIYAGTNAGNSAAVFSRDMKTGQLTFVENHNDDTGGVDGLASVMGCGVSPDGRNVYFAAYSDNAVSVFSRNDTTGALTFVEVVADGANGVDGLMQARSLAFSPDGQFVYVGGYGEDAVAVFKRNITTGELTFIELHVQGVNGVAGIDASRAMACSPDGAYLYVAGMVSDAIAVFARNEVTGRLTYSSNITHAQLDGPTKFTISSDGAHLYVGGFELNTLLAFSRDAVTGALTYVSHYVDGTNGVDGIAGPMDVVISTNGKHVYVASYTDNTVSVFDRNTSTGDLTYVDNQPGGLTLATALAITPDGAHVYATYRGGNAVSGYQTAPPSQIYFPNLVYGGPRDTVRAPILSDFIYPEDSVLSVNAKFLYPDSIMHFVGIDTLGGFQMSGFTFDDSVYAHNTGDQPDTLVIAGASASPLTGAGPLFELVFVVDSNSVDGDTASILFEDFELNEGFPLLEWTGGFFENAIDHLIGDVDSSGTIEALDASLILQETVHKYTPEDSNQIERMDVSGNGTIHAFDASLILQHVAGMITTFPAGSTFVDKPVVAAEANVTLDVVQGDEQIIIVSVGVTGIQALSSAELTLKYDQDQLTYLGYTLPGDRPGFQMETLDEEGTLSLAMAAAQPWGADGPMVRLRFRLLGDIMPQSQIELTSVWLDEQLVLDAAKSATVAGLPTTYAISQNYPNPFNPVTTIRYQIPEDVQVRITVHNLLGQVVATLVDEQLSAGYYQTLWDGRNHAGLQAASGVYLYRIQAGNYIKTKKMLLLK
jgi:6-phosphogluconolactonase (cycloisomerase 2 family)